MTAMSFLDEEPQGDKTTKWAGGVVAPLPFVIYGLLCVFNRVGAVPGRRSDSTLLVGMDAVILGMACLSFASLLHFHYYWGLSQSDTLKDNYDYGKFASIVVLICSLGWVAWCLLRGFGELY